MNINNKFAMNIIAIIAILSLIVACSNQNKNESVAETTNSSTTAESVTNAQSNKASNVNAADKEIIDTIVDNFMILTKVPRPSHHEEKISAFLYDWAKNAGFSPEKDKVNNIKFDVPATKGFEDKPLVILQGHMDMVVAVADGKTFDPLNDPITAIRNDEKGTLTADGTSLGTDDGVGVSTILSIAQGKMDHGPLRMIITVDEEDGMYGAFNMSKDWFDGATYLINIDSETSDEVLVSTAAGDGINATKKIDFANPTGNKALNITISNLQGGHSGVEIDKGRLNGIIGLASLLKEFDNDGITYELSSFDGGTASNAIPAKASTIIVVNAEDVDKIKNKVAEYNKSLNDKYKGIENNIEIDVSDVNELPQVISKKEKDNLIKFITTIINGVYSMSKDMKDLVESSSNLGLVKLNKDGINITIYNRSSSPDKETEINDSQKNLAKECGYEIATTKMAEPWKFDPNSKLLEICKDVYKAQNGEDIKVVALHAGPECGCFKNMKPDLDMISIGPDLSDVHSIKETLYLNSIPKVWHLLEGILKNV